MELPKLSASKLPADSVPTLIPLVALTTIVPFVDVLSVPILLQSPIELPDPDANRYNM